MPHSTIRIVLVGHHLPQKPIETHLMAIGAENYLCCGSLAAAEWLMRDGFDADLLLIDERLLADPGMCRLWQRNNPQALSVVIPRGCNDRPLDLLLSSALNRVAPERRQLAS